MSFWKRQSWFAKRALKSNCDRLWYGLFLNKGLVRELYIKTNSQKISNPLEQQL